MAITKVVPAVIAVTNNITSNTFGSANTIPSFQIDGSGVIVAASNTAISLSANSVANNQFQTGSVENYMRAQGNASVFAGMRNRIINGAMQIDQRNDGAAITQSTSGVYSADRWKTYGAQAAKFSIQQDSSANTVAGFSNSLKVTSLSSYSVTSTDEFEVYHLIEGYNSADLAWGTASAKTVTLSFWVRSSLTGTHGGAIRNNSANRSYPFSYTIVAADTWEQKIITIPGDQSGTWDKTNTTGILVIFNLGAGSTMSGTSGAWAGANYTAPTGATSVVGTNAATWYITGVQFEAGSTATPFEYRQYTTELALCQRYLPMYRFITGQELAINGMTYGTNYSFHGITLPVQPRVAPTGITYTGTLSSLVLYVGSTTPSLIGLVFSSGSTTYATIRCQVAPSSFSNAQACMLASELSATSKLLFTGCEL